MPCERLYMIENNKNIGIRVSNWEFDISRIHFILSFSYNLIKGMICKTNLIYYFELCLFKDILLGRQSTLHPTPSPVPDFESLDVFLTCFFFTSCREVFRLWTIVCWISMVLLVLSLILCVFFRKKRRNIWEIDQLGTK